MENVLAMLVRGGYYAALGVWVGCMVMISAGAPAIFRTIPAKSQAGDVVGAWLKVYYRIGLACAAAAWFCTLYRYWNWEIAMWHGPWGFAKAVGACRIGLLSQMILNHLYAGWGLDPEIHRVRALPEADPARAAFGPLHRRSVKLLGANLFAGLAVIFLS